MQTELSSHNEDAIFIQPPPPYPPPLPIQLDQYISQSQPKTEFLKRLLTLLAKVPLNLKRLNTHIKPRLAKIRDIPKSLLGKYFKEFRRFMRVGVDLCKNFIAYLQRAPQSPYKVFGVTGIGGLVLSLLASPFVSPTIWLIVAFSALIQLVIAAKLKLSRPS